MNQLGILLFLHNSQSSNLSFLAGKRKLYPTAAMRCTHAEIKFEKQTRETRSFKVKKRVKSCSFRSHYSHILSKLHSLAVLFLFFCLFLSDNVCAHFLFLFNMKFRHDLILFFPPSLVSITKVDAFLMKTKLAYRESWTAWWSRQRFVARTWLSNRKSPSPLSVGNSIFMINLLFLIESTSNQWIALRGWN